MKWWSIRRVILISWVQYFSYYKKECIEKCLECSRCSKVILIGNSCHHWITCFDFFVSFTKEFEILSSNHWIKLFVLEYTIGVLSQAGKKDYSAFITFSQWHICQRHTLLYSIVPTYHQPIYYSPLKMLTITKEGCWLSHYIVGDPSDRLDLNLFSKL